MLIRREHIKQAALSDEYPRQHRKDLGERAGTKSPAIKPPGSGVRLGLTKLVFLRFGEVSRNLMMSIQVMHFDRRTWDGQKAEDTDSFSGLFRQERFFSLSFSE